MNEFGSALLPQHAALLRESSIAPEVARERGYRSADTKAQLERHGFGITQRRVPALLIPIYGVDGEVVLHQARPDNPRVRGGKPLRYETPTGSRLVLDVPPRMREHLSDPSLPLLVTEGSRKADAAVSRGLDAIALLGVWGWRGSNEKGGKTALPDWDSIALNGRDVLIAFDSDAMVNSNVHTALEQLARFLKRKGAIVQFVYLPPGADGAKTGVDDFLTAGHTVEDLVELAEPDLRPPSKSLSR